MCVWRGGGDGFTLCVSAAVETTGWYHTQLSIGVVGS